MCAKEIGSKMKRKEPIGEDVSVPPEVVDKLHDQTITAEDVRVSVHIHVHVYITANIYVYMSVNILVFHVNLQQQ